MSVIAINELKKRFTNGEVEEEILKGINLELQPREITALVGASGSGKSTLLTIAAGLQPSSEGSIVFNGQDLTQMNSEEIRKIRAKDFGFVFQSSHLVPFLTVEEQLYLMLEVAGKHLSKVELQKEVRELLQRVGMEHRKNAYPSSLSGGERQRVAIARAIVHRPKILFADEPTASLDSLKSKDVMKLIRELTTSFNITTLIVTHDREMLDYVDNIITMKDGFIQSN
ncbi:ABC transporter ATP-binding protein [Chryseomicrobium palamuruense]|uniref:Putative hemin import ATP-binding protein HrtA n=1 Tax=Chryseomicrobium palamuruense TaxID=682973 RepID=A0ABV8UTD5_9BACL